VVRAQASQGSIEHYGCSASRRRQALAAGAALVGGALLPSGLTPAVAAASKDSIHALSALMHDKEVSFAKYSGQVGHANIL
jgi:hypothetical protein